MAPSSGELWGHHLMPQMITVDCLLPNGVIVPLRCYRDSTLDAIKGELWREAQNYPLYHTLQDPNSYIFVSITQDAEREEFYDETRRLCDLRLFQPILKLVEPKGNKEEKMLNASIGIALGLPIHEFDESKDLEVMEFRRHILEVCAEAVATRDAGGKESQALYAYPPETENTSDLPTCTLARLEQGAILIQIWSLSDLLEQQYYTVAVHHSDPPEKIIREAIYKKIRNSDQYRTVEDKKAVVFEHQSSYVLKVAGTDQYFLKQCPISQYKYIRSCIAKGDTPQLMLMYKKKVYDSLPESSFHPPSYMRKPLTIPIKQSMLLWRVDKYFRLHVLSATYVNVKDVDQIFVRVGLFHGTEPLCPVKETKPVGAQHPRWDQWLEFDIYVPDLPRSAKLCLSICSVKKQRRNREENTMLCWGNVSLFDYRHCLLTEKFSLNLWPLPRGMQDDLLNSLGPTGSNPIRESPCLELEFDSHDAPSVVYPDTKDFKEYAVFVQKLDPRHYNVSAMAPQAALSNEEDAQLFDIQLRDPLAEISEQEKDMLWRLRGHAAKYPNILPRLLDAVKWNSRDDITQLYLLLEDWPPVAPQTALELLDCKYADVAVRRKAVQWLDQMSDEDFAQYLLQLVQTLKYEPYLDNPLCNLLLRRALLNRKIGHFFFWHLKAELQDQSLVRRFGLLLEAYCRGLGSYLKDLNKQVEANEKLTKLTDSIKEKYQDIKISKYLTDQMNQADYAESLQLFHSPLENTVMLGELKIEECKVMDSAKKPLWLVWQNPDPLSGAPNVHSYNAIIFKNGDDLRQDMLTLQVIKIMDHIWHTEGVDLRMTPYTCLATGHQVGMIEVVRNAKTVYQIQCMGGKLAALQLETMNLYNWIRDHNKDRLDQAIQTFTHSCAGYCVATFILGIGDRHPDNIMVNEEGQIFHIDFGHFLGHFKKKFGINRERVPFVLTDDFARVISKGKDSPMKSEEFAQFQKLCGEAYLALRKHANLLITLFTMMLPTGITELQSINDVEYLRQTLAVEKSEEEALKYFQDMFNDAYKGAWTTKVDWFFHRVKHGV